MQTDEAFWRKYARIYDEVLNVIPYRNLLLEVVDRSKIEPSMKVLDAGTGTANVLWALDQQGITCSVTGIDSSKAMLAKAATKTAKYPGSVTFVQADLDDSADHWGNLGPFDRFIFNNTLWLLKNPTQALQKMRNLAAAGARLVASTPRPGPNVSELLEEHLLLSENAGVPREEALQRLQPLLQPLMECNEILMKRYGDSYHLPNEPLLRSWFEDSGWKITDLTTAYAGQNWMVTAIKNNAA